MHTDDMEIGKTIARLRERRGWTQAELARRIGRDRRIIGSVETGQTPPSAALLITLEKALGVEWGELQRWFVVRSIELLARKLGMSPDDVCKLYQRL